jgi:protein-S-isoprenylcysteine O-methyltransferase Ste14
MSEPSSDTPHVLVFPPVLFVGTLAIGLLLHWLKPIAILPAPPARILGLALLISSMLLVRAAEKAMKSAGTNVRPDQPSLAVVTGGPFRFSRNPMYLGSIGLYLAVAFLLNTVWPLLMLPIMGAVLHWGVVRREERYLEAKFATPYREYRNRVRRWI